MGPFSSSWGCSAYSGAPGSVPCGGVTWLGALDSWTGRRARVRSRLAEAEGTQSWNRMGCSNFFGLVSINCKKTGCPELVKAGYPKQIREIRKRSGKQSNRFRPDSEFDIPYYRTEIRICPKMRKRAGKMEKSVRNGTGFIPTVFNPSSCRGDRWEASRRWATGAGRKHRQHHRRRRLRRPRQEEDLPRAFRLVLRGLPPRGL